MANFTFWERAFFRYISYLYALPVLVLSFIYLKGLLIQEIWECLGVGRTLRNPKYRSILKERHQRKVDKILKQVQNWDENDRGTKKMCSARAGWKMFSFGTPVYKTTSTLIDLSELNDIIELDEKNRTVTLEPNINMGKLCRILLPLNWTLEVLPELEELTIGGLINGAGIETSSHKIGLFQECCTEFEIALPNGKAVKCSKDKNTDLFRAIPWSHGTLGFLTQIKLRIIPTEKYVKVQYFPTKSLEETTKTFETQVRRTEGNQFVEGIMFSLDQGVIMVGNFARNVDSSKVNRIGLWYKPWFYKHCQSITQSGYTEYIPLRDYYFRHQRSTFWEQRALIPFGNNPIFRALFGWLMPANIQLGKYLFEKGKHLVMKNHVIEDFGVPLNKLKNFLIYVDQETKIYPIWLCGLIIPPPYDTENGGRTANDYIYDEKCPWHVDIGVYGIARSNLEKENREDKILKLEKMVIKNRSFKGLYADAHVDKDDFKQMFCHELYDYVRKKYGCTEAFPDIYDKVKYGIRQ